MYDDILLEEIKNSASCDIIFIIVITLSLGSFNEWDRSLHMKQPKIERFSSVFILDNIKKNVLYCSIIGIISTSGLMRTRIQDKRFCKFYINGGPN